MEGLQGRERMMGVWESEFECFLCFCLGREGGKERSKLTFVFPILSFVCSLLRCRTRYFTCPPMCGIFLQYSKLSSPTTGPGSARPSSVMSNRSSVRGSESLSGRVTPSLSGRATPSGRSTPSHNGLPRPPPLSSSLQQSRTASKSSAEASALAESNITAGSRASKYLGEFFLLQLDIVSFGEV